MTLIRIDYINETFQWNTEVLIKFTSESDREKFWNVPFYFTLKDRKYVPYTEKNRVLSSPNKKNYWWKIGFFISTFERFWRKI